MPPAIKIDGLLNQLDVKSSKDKIELEGNLLEKHETLIREILTSDNDHFLIAPPGSGKTFAVIALAHGYNSQPPIKTILAVPLVMIADQKEKFFRERNYNSIGKVIGSSKKINGETVNATNGKEIASFFTDVNAKNIIICVFDSINKIVEIAGKKISEYILIIDECHQLTNSCNFRLKAINNLTLSIPKFKKTVYMTGTPEGIYHLNDPAKTTIFIKKTLKKKQTINIIYYDKPSSSKDFTHLYELYKHLEYSKQTVGKRVILIDNRNTLLHLKVFLENHFNKKVEVLTSLDRDSEEYSHLIEEKRISDDTDFILTTRMISDGADILNDDIAAVYIVNVNDFLIKRQFLGRFRSERFSIYELIERPETDVEVINFNKQSRMYENEIGSYGFKHNLFSSSQRRKALLLYNEIERENRSPFSKVLLAKNFAMDDVNTKTLYSSLANMKSYYKKFSYYKMQEIQVSSIAGSLPYNKFTTKLDADFSNVKENIEWYCENLSSIVVYNINGRKFNDVQDLIYAQRRILSTKVNAINFGIENKILLKKKYQYESKNKVVTKSTRFWTIYPAIEKLIKEGCDYELVQNILRYGLSQEGTGKFTKLMSLIDIYFYYLIYKHLFGFDIIIQIVPELNIVVKILKQLKLKTPYFKSQLIEIVKYENWYPLKEYATDAIFQKEETVVKRQSVVVLNELNTLESLLKANNIDIPEDVSWYSTEIKISVYRIIKLLEEIEATLPSRISGTIYSSHFEHIQMTIAGVKECYLPTLELEFLMHPEKS